MLPVGVPATWKLTFGDEFNGAAVDKTKWQTQWRECDKDGKIFYQPYRFGAVNLESNLTVKNGALTIRSNREGVGWDPKVQYTTGVINTAQKFSQKYGYFEIRLKSPNAKARGTDGDFFLFAEANQWPPELDVCEIPGSGEAKKVLLNQHYRRPDGTRASNEKYYALPSGTFADGWHTFGLLWDPNLLVWYVDGVERHRCTTGVPDQNMVLFCSVEIPGNWTGESATGAWSQFQQVDYIRVYQRASPAAAKRPKQP
jgi:beta-glucanase (GH16 family)